MKPRSLLLTLSLLANAALLYAWASRHSAGIATARATTAATVADHRADRPNAAAGAGDAGAPALASKASAPTATSWSAFQTDDLDEVTRLAATHGLQRRKLVRMPANNLTLVFSRSI